jgi:hypothetical protein
VCKLIRKDGVFSNYVTSIVELGGGKKYTTIISTKDYSVNITSGVKNLRKKRSESTEDFRSMMISLPFEKLVG